ncbi:MAG: AsmA family protein [Gammaproteobacteria bacterium]
MKLIKILLLSVVSLALMAVLALVLAFYLIDPNRYKPAIENVFEKSTGIELNVAGDITWTFNPVFGLSISDLRLSNPASPAELASLSHISIKVEPRALLDGRLQMQEFIAQDLHINWIVDAEGNGNWPLPTNDSAAQPVVASNDSDTPISATIEQITIRNASLAIQDSQLGINTNFDNLNFNSRNTNLENRPFPFDLGFEVTDNIADQNANISIASTATVDLSRGNVRLDDLQIKLNPLQLSGNIAITDMNNALGFSGSLNSNTFTLSDFLDVYVREAPASAGLGEYNTDEDQFNLALEFNGNAQQITIPALTVALDDMRVELDAEYQVATTAGLANLRYNLNANALDLNRYTSPAAEVATEEESAAAAVPPAQDTELPIELLQSMNVQASHSIESLAVAGYQFGAINAQIGVQDGVLNFDLRPVPFYEGQITTTVSFDTRPNPASLTAMNSLQNVNVAGLAQALPLAEFAQGRLNVESVHTLRGRTVNQLLDSVSGTTSFSLNDNTIDIGIVKQLFSSISVLSPAGTGDLAQQWPDTVSFSNFAGHLILAQGLAENQEVKITMDNFEIAATGGIDLPAESFNYNATLTVFGEPAPQTIPVGELYQGVGWPVVCDARFDADFSEYCGPDFGRVRDLFVEISRNAVQRRVQDAVTERVPEELQDAARGLLDRFRR